jgi:hypothetical protein
MAPQPKYSNICYFNCRGLNNKKEIIEEFLYKENIDICAICETKYKPQNKQKLKHIVDGMHEKPYSTLLAFHENHFYTLAISLLLEI